MRLIDVDALCDEIESVEYSGHDPEVERICSLIQKAKWIDAEPRWIPFKARELTDEEKEEHPEYCFIFDCQMPEDGQRILVSIDGAGHERVQLDEFYEDDGIYLDSGYEIGREAVAWMPLPEPYKEAER